PQNCAQTSSVGPAKISHQTIDLRVGNFCRDAIHSTLAVQCFAQGSRGELTRLERPQHCQPARINRIDHLFQLQKVAHENFPAMPQGRRRFQRPIISGIVEPRNVECIVDLVLSEIAPPSVIAMREDKASLKPHEFQLSDPRNFFRHERFEQLLGFLHRRARQMIRATPSRKSRSDLPKALTFALSTLITPRTRSCSSSIIGTITSDFVDQKFGRKPGSLLTSGTITVRRSSSAL